MFLELRNGYIFYRVLRNVKGGQHTMRNTDTESLEQISSGKEQPYG